jgi:type IV secretory pathway VirB10-like protein
MCIRDSPPVMPAPVMPQPVMPQPVPAFEATPSPVVAGGSSTRLAAAPGRPSWPLWAGAGVVGLLMVIALVVLLTSGPEEVAREGQGGPPDNAPVETPPKPPPKEPPKPPPKEQPKQVPKEKPKEPPKEVPKEQPKEQPKEPPPEPQMGPVPEAAALAAAEEQLKEGLPAEAPKLIDAANADGRTRAQRYVLLTRARDLATEAGDVPTALRTIGEIEKRFTIDVAAAKAQTRTKLADALKRLADAASDSKAAHAVAENGLRLIEEARAAGQIDLAKSMATIALGAARKAGDPDLVGRITLAILEIQKGG